MRYVPIVGPTLIGRGGSGSASACDPQGNACSAGEFPIASWRGSSLEEYLPTTFVVVL